MQARPILGDLLSRKVITEDERGAMLEFLGSADNTDAESLQAVANLAQNNELVFDTLANGILQKHDYRPAELPDTVPLSAAAQAPVI